MYKFILQGFVTSNSFGHLRQWVSVLSMYFFISELFDLPNVLVQKNQGTKNKSSRVVCQRSRP